MNLDKRWTSFLCENVTGLTVGHIVRLVACVPVLLNTFFILQGIQRRMVLVVIFFIFFKLVFLLRCCYI